METHVVNPTGQHHQTIILLHDHNSTGKDLCAHLVQALNPIKAKDLFPHARFVLPTAARTITGSSGQETRTWFSQHRLADYDHSTDADGWREVARVGAELMDVVRKEAAVVGFENVFVGGLGMGCAIGMVMLLQLETPVGGFFGVGGFMPFVDDIKNVAVLGTFEGKPVTPARPVEEHQDLHPPQPQEQQNPQPREQDPRPQQQQNPRAVQHPQQQNYHLVQQPQQQNYQLMFQQAEQNLYHQVYLAEQHYHYQIQEAERLHYMQLPYVQLQYLLLVEQAEQQFHYRAQQAEQQFYYQVGQIREAELEAQGYDLGLFIDPRLWEGSVDLTDSQERAVNATQEGQVRDAQITTPIQPPPERAVDDSRAATATTPSREVAERKAPTPRAPPVTQPPRAQSCEDRLDRVVTFLRALSGHTPEECARSNAVTTPLILLHATQDPTVPMFHGKLLLETVQKLGFKASLTQVTADEHGVTQQMLETVLTRILDRRVGN